MPDMPSNTNGGFSYDSARLKSLASEVLAYACDKGATAAEVEVSEGRGQNVTVRHGEVETIEYNRDKGAGVTVYIGHRRGHASTSDFSSRALRDAVDAYRLLIAKGISPESVVIAGDGAGGGLAFATVMAIRNASMPTPAGCVAMSPWADMTLSGWSLMQNAEADTVMSWELLFLSARHCLKGSNPADPYASPVFGNMRDFPPIMVHAGSLEILRDDASRLGELAASANVPVSVEVYDGMPHCFQA